MDIQGFIYQLAERFDDVEAKDLTPETEFQELDEWSSLTAMSIIAMAKKVFNKTVTGREIRSCKTIKDLYNLITNK